MHVNGLISPTTVTSCKCPAFCNSSKELLTMARSRFSPLMRTCEIPDSVNTTFCGESIANRQRISWFWKSCLKKLYICRVQRVVKRHTGRLATPSSLPVMHLHCSKPLRCPNVPWPLSWKGRLKPHAPRYSSAGLSYDNFTFIDTCYDSNISTWSPLSMKNQDMAGREETQKFAKNRKELQSNSAWQHDLQQHDVAMALWWGHLGPSLLVEADGAWSRLASGGSCNRSKLQAIQSNPRKLSRNDMQIHANTCEYRYL